MSMRSCFDPGPDGVKGPSLSWKLPLGGTKFSPCDHASNWRERVGKETIAAMRTGGPPVSFSAKPNLQSSRVDEPEDAHLRMYKYLTDPTVRQALRSVKQRVSDIDRGVSPVSPFPVRRCAKALPSKRGLLLSAAAPYLNQSEVCDLEDFLSTRLAWSRSATPTGVSQHSRGFLHQRPQSQMHARPPLISSRPLSGVSQHSRSSSHQRPQSQQHTRSPLVAMRKLNRCSSSPG